VMVNAARSGGDVTMFMSGNNAEAKAETLEILKQFGWNDVIDLGDITTARGTEMLLPVWLRLYGTFKSPYFGFKIVR
jgi:predicted dinucleotide-binding enzyme